MVDLRRWYTYLVSAITLQATAWALIFLGREVIATELDREGLAIELAVIVVAFPLFLAHWLWAERETGRDPEERGAFPRRLYVYGMMAAFLIPLLVNGFVLLQSLFLLFVGVEFTDQSIYFGVRSNSEVVRMALPAVVVLTAGWLYHWYVKRVDDSQQAESDASGVLHHLYFYGFALVGLATTAMAAGQLVHWLLNLAIAAATLAEPARMFFPVELARLVIGLPLWLACWLPRQQAFAAGEKRERESVVRKLTLYLVVFAGAVAFIGTLSALLADVLARLFGLRPAPGDLSTALAVIIVSGAVWAYHAFVLRVDAAAEAEVGMQALVRRIYTYLMAGLGLAVLLIGTAGALTVVIQAVEGGGFDDDLRLLMARFLAAITAGLVVWLWQWTQAIRQVRSAPPAGIAEQRSFVRRLYLYAYFFGATMVILGSAVVFVSQVFMVLMGAREGAELRLEMALAVTYGALALVLWLYHGLMLRRDQQAVRAAEIARQRSLHVAVVDAGDGTLGHALQEKLHEQVPGALVQPVGLTPAAVAAMNGGVAKMAPADVLAEAEVIVGPWSMAVPAGHGGIIPAEFAAAVNASPAYKILMPEPEQGLAWAGVEPWQVERIAKDVAADVRRLSLGEEPAGRRQWSPWAVVVIVLASIFVLTTALPALLTLLFEG